MVEKILIANRGEIACRAIRTAKKLGIALSRSIQMLMPVTTCQTGRRSQFILVNRLRKSYLQVERIIQAAKITGAKRFTQGYGFLSKMTNLPCL